VGGDVLFLGEAILEGEQSEEFAAGAVLEYEVKLLVVLEALAEAYEEGVGE
jgi:hypothetical protein